MPTLTVSNEELIALSILAAIGSTVASASEVHDHLEVANKLTIELDDQAADYLRHQMGMLGTALYAYDHPTSSIRDVTEEQARENFRRCVEVGSKANESLMQAAVAIYDRLGAANPNLDKPA